MKTQYYENSKDYINRWVVSYADFVTMLLALFMVLWAVSGLDKEHNININQSLEKTFSNNVKISQEKKENILQTVNPQNQVISNIPIGLTQEEILKKIKTNVSATEGVNVFKSSRGVVIRLNNLMFFDEGSAIIKSEALSVLKDIAKSVREIGMPIIVEGHTDATPISNKEFGSNWELSTKRATNIIKILVEKYKISPQKLSAVGYGEYMPIADNETERGKVQNRRVDIIILSNN